MPTSYLGIDLHKRSSTWVLLDQNRAVRFKKTVPCTPQQVEAALKQLPVDPSTVQAVVEPVCAWQWFAGVLDHAGIDVHVANPLKTRLIGESKFKHDMLDARMLAELLKSGFLPESYRAPEDVQAMRSLVRERAYFVRLIVSVKNRIHGVLARRGVHTLALNPLGKRGKNALMSENDPEFSNLFELLGNMERQLKSFDARVMALCRKLPTAKLLMTMPGIGPITAVVVCAEVGDFVRFKRPEQLVAYAGLAPSQRSSGGAVRSGRITKQGSPLMRTMLVEASLRIRDEHDQLYAFYCRLAPNRGAMRARVALARKMLVIMWHMVRNNEPYRVLSSESAPKRDDLVELSSA